MKPRSCMYLFKNLSPNCWPCITITSCFVFDHLKGTACFPFMNYFQLNDFIIMLILETIVGFHMMSIKFKLQNCRAILIGKKTTCWYWKISSFKILSSDIKTTSHIYKAIEFLNNIQRTQHHNVFKSCFYWSREKYTKPVSDLGIFNYKGYVLCTAEHCSLRLRKPKLYGDTKSRYPKITAAMEKFLYFWVDKPHKWATNSTGIRTYWINCPLYSLKVLLNLHNFPLLNINCTELYLDLLYISYIMVQMLNCKIPERVLLNGAIWKRFSKVSRRWKCAACHLLQVFTLVP